MADVLVVGAGQLGLMMASAGARFGISVDRIDHHNGEILPGTSRSRIQLSRDELLSTYPVITAELEHLLGNELVESLAQHDNWINARSMHVLPARNQQKALLDQLQIATAPWLLLAGSSDLAVAREQIGTELVVKSIRDGYDGKGQWVVTADSDGNIPDAAYGSIIAEQKIPFTRELSLIGARYRDGKCYFYPLVENYHQAGMLRYTLAPARHSGEQQQQAEAMLQTIMDELDYVGVMAMECFDSDVGLLVNELAPRVHNSGHWTQAGADISQFDLHLFAILDRSIEAITATRGCSMMLNLIGCEWNFRWQALDGVQCWWYGKSWREHRKLGHINIHAPSPQSLTATCKLLRPTLDGFHQQILDMAVNRLDAI